MNSHEPPYAAFLGICWTADGVARLPADASHVGDATRGSIHGGVIAAFLELAAAEHVQSRQTIDFSTDFLRAAPVADVSARVHVVRAGRRVTVVRVEA